MAHVTIRVPGNVLNGAAHRHVTLTTAQTSLTLPITSPEVEHTGRGAEWVEIDRPGQYPLVRRRGPRLRRHHLEVIFDVGGASVEPEMIILNRMASSDHPVRVAYGPLEAGLWRIEDHIVRSSRREVGTNHIVRARVAIDLVEARDDSSVLPSARAPVATPTAPATSSAPAGVSGSTSQPQTHVVKSGETLSRIALDHCGNANLWPKIAEANKLRNPHLIFPGQRLTIPC